MRKITIAFCIVSGAISVIAFWLLLSGKVEVHLRGGKRHTEYYNKIIERSLRLQVMMDADGRKHGTECAWYSWGEIMRVCTYKRGVLHGVCTIWDLDGAIYCHGIYKDGNPYTGTFLPEEEWDLDSSDVYHGVYEYKDGVKTSEAPIFRYKVIAEE